MIVQTQQDNEKFPQFYSRRKDKASAKVVDEGVHFQNTNRTKYAATYLRFKGISQEVAVRVLSQPLQRRQSQ